MTLLTPWESQGRLEPVAEQRVDAGNIGRAEPAMSMTVRNWSSAARQPTHPARCRRCGVVAPHRPRRRDRRSRPRRTRCSAGRLRSANARSRRRLRRLKGSLQAGADQTARGLQEVRCCSGARSSASCTCSGERPWTSRRTMTWRISPACRRSPTAPARAPRGCRRDGPTRSRRPEGSPSGRASRGHRAGGSDPAGTPAGWRSLGAARRPPPPRTPGGPAGARRA